MIGKKPTRTVIGLTLAGALAAAAGSPAAVAQMSGMAGMSGGHHDR